MRAGELYTLYDCCFGGRVHDIRLQNDEYVERQLTFIYDKKNVHTHIMSDVVASLSQRMQIYINYVSPLAPQMFYIIIHLTTLWSLFVECWTMWWINNELFFF